MSELVGRTLGPYRVLAQLGMGGMATVYKAYHPAMDRYVALKVLPRHLARDQSFRARFEREARTIARLEHRYILPVHDVGEEDDIPFLVMRYTDGGTLADLIARGGLSLQRAVELVLQVGEALAYAHRQGVVHRDIKPANVLIGRDGDALLSDFGIARILEGTLQLTSEGVLMGTPFYMAPEQVRGQAADARSDLYALGVVLYEVSTGRRPFMAETPLAVALMHVHEPLPPPRQLRPELPEALERIILRAMAKEPDDRFQTADELVQALREALADLAVGAAPTRPAAVAARPTETAVLNETAVVGAPATLPLPAEPAPPAQARRLPRRWLALAALGLCLLLGVGLLLRPGRVRPRPPPGPDRVGAGQSPAPAATSAAPAGAPLPAATAAGPARPAAPASLAVGPTLTPRQNLRVLTNTATIYGLAELGGYVWAATSGGLVRWDAAGQARVFTAADGLPFNDMRAVVAMPDGSLWVGGDAGVAHVRPVADGLGEVQAYGPEQGMESGYVRALMVDSDGSVWAAGQYGRGLSRFDGSAWDLPELPLDAPALQELPLHVQSLLRTSDGALWLGLDQGGLLRWDGQAWTQYAEQQGVDDDTIYGLLEDRSGTLWAAAGDAGLLRLDASQGRWQQVPVLQADAPIWQIVQLSSDASLLASSSDFIARSLDGGQRWTETGREGAGLGWGVGPLLQDTAGRIWAGSEFGLARFDGRQWRRLLVEGELPEPTLGQLLPGPDQQLVVIPAYGGRPALVNVATMQVSEPAERGIEELRVYSLAFMPNALWLGTGDGLLRLRQGARLRLSTAQGLPSDEVRQLLGTQDRLWIGTQAGLAWYDLQQDRVGGSVPEFEGTIVTLLFQAPDGALWAGSLREGETGQPLLGRFDGSAWQIWRTDEGPLSQEAQGVTAISADDQGQIWVASWSGGLWRWNGSDWSAWRPEDGAPAGNVLALAARADEMWAGGQLDNRLYRWNRDGWAELRVDGLSGEVTSIYSAPDGALWLATSDGLLRYQP